MILGKHSSGSKKHVTVDRNYMFGGITNLGMPGTQKPEDFANSDHREGRLRKKAKARS